MQSDHKIGAMVIIWSIVGGLLVLVLIAKLLTGGELTFNETILGAAGLLAAGLASYGIAISGRDDESPSATSRRARRGTGKAKTSDMALVDRMIDTLSDEEIAALRRRLSSDHGAQVGDDGEVVSLDDVLRERRS